MPLQEQLRFNEYHSLYDLIVQNESLLRKINDLIDFSFVYDELVTKYCHNNGRAAESPLRMFMYLLLKKDRKGSHSLKIHNNWRYTYSIKIKYFFCN